MEPDVTTSPDPFIDKGSGLLGKGVSYQWLVDTRQRGKVEGGSIFRAKKTGGNRCRRVHLICGQNCRIIALPEERTHTNTM